MQAILDSIFKAYDVRGRVGEELSEDVVRRIGAAFGVWLPTQGAVAVGRDMRPDSAALAAALIAGLRSVGRDVWDIGEVTSDMIYYAVGAHSLAGGAMVTASHNPGEYNGIKFCRDEAQAVGVESGLLDIKQLTLTDQPLAAAEGTLTQKDVVEGWIDHVLSFVDVDTLKPLKLAVDAGNGMVGKIFPELEPYVPFEVREMYFELDGTFPNHIANPLEAKNLVDVVAAVREGACDAGLAFDGDGDRAVLIDETGEPLSGTVVTALLARYFLQKQPGATILYNAICGQIVPETIQQLGGTGVRTKVGHSYIKAEMRARDAIFGGEHSGHYYFRDNYRADSGLLAAVIALAVLSASDQPLSELVRPFREAYVQIPETNFEVADKAATLDRLKTEFADGHIDELDGLTVRLSHGWVNVRPSNTEPLLRLNAEADSQEALDAMVARATSVIANSGETSYAK